MILNQRQDSVLSLVNAPCGLRDVVFEPFVQPKVCTRTLAPAAHEILMRPFGWPGGAEAFYRRLEGMGMMDRLMVEMGVIRQIGRVLPDLGFRVVSINASRALLASAIGLRSVLKLIRENRGIQITVEVLESEVTQIDQLSAAVGKLVDAGAQIALDDFGKAHSSLALFNSLPVVHEIKLDRSIVHGQRACEIIGMVAGMAQSVGAVTTAEHIDSAESLAMIARCGVNFAQGYYVGMPYQVQMPAAAV